MNAMHRQQETQPRGSRGAAEVQPRCNMHMLHVPPQETDKLLAASPSMPPPPSAGDPEMAAWLSVPASQARGLSARPRLTAR